MKYKAEGESVHERRINLHRLDKSTLKPGDIVGIPHVPFLGWKTFRYPKMIPKAIKRITPARTKFIMEDDTKYNKYADFYPITDEIERRSKVAFCAENINKSLFALVKLYREDKILTKNDDTVVKVSDMLNEIMQVLQEASDADIHHTKLHLEGVEK